MSHLVDVCVGGGLSAENKGRLERDNELLRAELEKAQKSVQSWKNKYLKARDLLREHGISELNQAKEPSLKGSTKTSSITVKEYNAENICSHCERFRQIYLTPPTCGENRVGMKLSMELTNLEEHQALWLCGLLFFRSVPCCELLLTQALLRKFNDLLSLTKGILYYFEPSSIPATLKNYLKSDHIQNLKLAEKSTWSGECLGGIPFGKGTLTDSERNLVENVVMIGEKRIGESSTITKSGENEIVVETYYDQLGNRHGPYKYLEKKGQTSIFYQEGVFKHDELAGPIYEKNSNPQEGYYRFGFRSVTSKYVELVMDLALTTVTYVEEENEQRTEKHFVAVNQGLPHPPLFGAVQKIQKVGADELV